MKTLRSLIARLIRTKVTETELKKAYIWQVKDVETAKIINKILYKFRAKGRDLVADKSLKIIDAELLTQTLDCGVIKTKRQLLRQISDALGDNWKDTCTLTLKAGIIHVEKAIELKK